MVFLLILSFEGREGSLPGGPFCRGRFAQLPWRW